MMQDLKIDPGMAPKAVEVKSANGKQTAVTDAVKYAPAVAPAPPPILSTTGNESEFHKWRMKLLSISGVERIENMGDVKFPVPYKQLTTDIKGIKTDLVLCSYDDHILVMATQIGAVGTMLHARKEEGFASNATFNVSLLFGKRDEPMLVGCARRLIEHMSDTGSSRPLLISLGLKDHSVETLKGIIEVIKANKVW